MPRPSLYPEDNVVSDLERRLGILERALQRASGEVPAGVIASYGASAAPSGWLLCNGQAVSRTEHEALFAAIGTIWGAGDGSTTFNLPDFRGRFLFGQAASGTGSTFASLFGAINHTHTGPSHAHSQENTGNAGGHTHTSAGAHGGHGAAGGHTHTSDGAHSGHGTHDHSFSDSFTTGNESATQSNVNVTGATTVARANHTHSGSVSGTTGTGGSSTSAGGHTHNSIADHSHTTSAGGHTHDTIANHSHTNPTTNAAGTGNTGTANPPGAAVIWIIRR